MAQGGNRGVLEGWSGVGSGAMAPKAFAGGTFPAVILDAGPDAVRRFVEFFTANIRNSNTRAAYARAVAQFLEWCDERAIRLRDLSPFLVAAYIEELPHRPVQHRRTRRRHHESGRPFVTTVATLPLSPPAIVAIKQHLAAIRMLMDWLVIGQILPSNPAASVRGPRHVVKRGKTPVLEAEDARRLLDSIDTSTPTSRPAGTAMPKARPCSERCKARAAAAPSGA